ncbi:MAG: glycoside hydrolase family 108 protein [Variovorax sp.]|nr:glycoside hydrolase family 108 protein [Variovorax sp.]
MTFDEAFDRLIGHEGGYSDNPADPGGKTMWGVTEKVARAKGYKGDMRDLPQSFAKAVVYRPDYWDAVRADELPDSVRFDVFDAAVNHGASQAAKWLQRAAGATPDGVIGARTVAAARGAGPMLAAHFNGERLQFYTDLGTWPTFGKGWARRVASNLKRLEA